MVLFQPPLAHTHSASHLVPSTADYRKNSHNPKQRSPLPPRRKRTGKVPGIQIYFTSSSRGDLGAGGAGEAGGQHTSVLQENTWSRPVVGGPALPGHCSRRMARTAQAQGSAAFGKRVPSGKTSHQALGTEEVLGPSPTSLPSPAGSRKAKGAAGKPG